MIQPTLKKRYTTLRRSVVSDSFAAPWIRLQGIFLTQEWNPCLWHWQDSLPLSHLGGPVET